MIKKDPKSDSPKKDADAILKAIVRNKNRIQAVGYNNMKGALVRRIFNNGGATDGSRIGNYKPSTKRQRNRAGRRIDTVDLEMTGVLRRSIVVGKSGDDTVLGIRDLPEPVTEVTGVAKGGRRAGRGTLRPIGISSWRTEENAIQQEKNFNKEIFAPSEAEIEKGHKAVLKEVNIVSKKALK